MRIRLAILLQRSEVIGIAQGSVQSLESLQIPPLPDAAYLLLQMPAQISRNAVVVQYGAINIEEKHDRCFRMVTSWFHGFRQAEQYNLCLSSLHKPMADFFITTNARSDHWGRP